MDPITSIFGTVGALLGSIGSGGRERDFVRQTVDEYIKPLTVPIWTKLSDNSMSVAESQVSLRNVQRFSAWWQQTVIPQLHDDEARALAFKLIQDADGDAPWYLDSLAFLQRKLNENIAGYNWDGTKRPSGIQSLLGGLVDTFEVNVVGSKWYSNAWVWILLIAVLYFLTRKR